MELHSSQQSKRKIVLVQYVIDPYYVKFMIKYLPLIISLSIPTEKPCFFQKNKYAQHIDYSSFNVIQKNNKNTLEYNTTTSQEIISQQNEKIIYQILIKEIK